MQHSAIYILLSLLFFTIVFFIYLTKTFNKDNKNNNVSEKEAAHLDLGIAAGFKFGIGFALAIGFISILLFIIFFILVGFSAQNLLR